jgi:large subunit ribosomal protein L16
MLLRPRNQKYKKSKKGRLKELPKPLANLEFGNLGLVCLVPCRIRASHIESCRLAIRRVIKREGEVFFRIFPHIPVTKKPQEVRMGKGKGGVDHFVARVSPNTVLFEIKYKGNPLIGIKALKVASRIIPVKTGFLTCSKPLIKDDS